MSGRRSLLSQATLIFVGKVSGFVLAFWIPIALVRLLSQEQFGAYKQFFLVGTTLISVLPLGLEASLFYFMPGDPRKAASYFKQTALWLFLMGSLTAGAILLFRAPLAEWVNAPVLVTLAPFLAVYVLLEMGGQLLNLTVVIEQQAKLAGLLFFTFDLLRTVALVLPAYLTRDIYWVAVGAAAYAVVRSLALIVWGYVHFRRQAASWFDTVLFRDQVRYALPFGASGLLDSGLQRFHQFYVSAVFSPAIFAVYAVGMQELAPIRLFFTSLFDVVLVRMTEHFRDGRLDEVRHLWRRLLSSQSVLVVPLFVIMWFLAPEFVEGLFTAAYVDAVPVFRVALAILLLTMINDHAVLRSCAMTGFIFKATIAGLAVSLLAVPLLTGMLGLKGAALGFVAGICVAKALGVWRIASLIDMSLFECLPWSAFLRYGGGALLAALVVLPTRGWAGGPLVTFFFTGGLFWLAYAAIVFFGRLLTSEDRELLGRAVAPLGRLVRAAP